MAQMNFEGSDEKRLTPEQRAKLYQSLEEKYGAASDMSGVESAEKKAKLQRMGAGLMDGFAMWTAADHQGTEPVKMDSMRAAADKRVADAKSMRADKMAGVLQTDKLERMGQDRAFEDKTRSRTEDSWKSDDEVKARENDPNSQESQMARDLAKKMMPSKDFGEMTAAELKRGLPTLEKIYSVEQARLARQDARADKAQATKDAKALADRNRQDKLDADQGEGYKTLDKEFAKDYNDWTSGGAKKARAEIMKLQGVADDLKSGKVTTGGATGMFPDRVTSNEVLAARADVNSTVMESLRAILGSAFTEKEGERIIKNTWNEGDSTENNLQRINNLIANLENQAVDKDAKSDYFRSNKGSLKNYNPSAGGGSSGGWGDNNPAKTGAKVLGPDLPD